jgi:hypothetical protein
MKTSRIFLLLLVFSSFITSMFGCAQKIPVHEAGYGLVAIPYHVINRSSIAYLHTYEWKSSTDEHISIKIDPGIRSDSIAFSDPIAEGQYTLDILVVRSVPQHHVTSSSSYDERALEDPFTIDVFNGEIGLVPVVFEFEQYLQGEQIMMKNGAVEFDDELEKAYHDRLEAMENSNLWKVRTL